MSKHLLITALTTNNILAKTSFSKTLSDEMILPFSSLFIVGRYLFITKSEDEVKSFLRLLFHITMPSLVNVFMSNNKELIYKNYCLELDILKRGFYR